MKRFLALLLLLAVAPLHAQTGAPFSAGSPTYPFSASATPASAIRISPNAGVNNCSNFLVYNAGTNVIWAVFSTSSAATVTIPSGSTSQSAIPFQPGQTVYTAFNNAWFNALTATGSDQLYVTCGTGGLSSASAAAGTGGGSTPVTPVLPTGSATQPGVSCATSSTTLLAASTATFPPVIRNEGTNTNAVWVNLAGASATAAVPNIQILPGQEIDTGVLGFTVISQINCIAVTAPTTVTLVYK